jgi:hypothetical protein
MSRKKKRKRAAVPVSPDIDEEVDVVSDPYICDLNGSQIPSDQ